MEWRVEEGMLLRDMIAIEAMKIIMQEINPSFKAIAKKSYEVADAMLRAREK